MTELETLYDRNSVFAQYFAFGSLPVRPKLSTIVLTCMDARLDPARFLGLEPGDAFVLRNASGRVTEAVERDVTFLWTQAAENARGGRPLCGPMETSGDHRLAVVVESGDPSASFTVADRITATRWH